MADRDFTFGGHQYKCNKINAMKQFHIARRMVPVLNGLAPQIPELAKMEKSRSSMDEDQLLEMTAKFLTPIMDGMSKLSDADSEVVIHGLLASVEVNRHGAWSYMSRDGRLVFEDIELPEMLYAAGRAFMFNMAGFFSVLPRVSKEKG